MPSATLRALLAELIDYAGLFPPAALPLTDVFRNFDVYYHSADAWALGRLVVPAARLPELSVLVGAASEHPWHVSALIGDDVARDVASVHDACARGRLLIDTLEARAPSVSAIEALSGTLGDSFTVYLEIPVDDDPRRLVQAIGRSGARAKIRTGGVTPEVFPTAAQCARFIASCAEHGVAFKATAGLHHPLRGDYRLTYAADAPRGTMFGFLNMFVAAAFARSGMPEETLAELLDERDAAAFRFTDDAIAWRSSSLSLNDVCAARATSAIAFGSCSFREPIDDLHQLGLL
jgi:hypothetical protein